MQGDSNSNNQPKENESWEGAFFHVFNRGVEKRTIFQDHGDYRRFILGLAAANTSQTVHLSNFYQGPTLVEVLSKIAENDRFVDIGAYCLMPNHFHLLVYERQARGVQRFIQKLSTGYTMYFNTKNERTGVLFQGKYKAKQADTDEYLKYLFAYIHLNPVSLFSPGWKEVGITDPQRIAKRLYTYPYSSYRDYQGVRRDENALVRRETFPAYFAHPRDFNEFVDEWFRYQDFAT